MSTGQQSTKYWALMSLALTFFPIGRCILAGGAEVLYHIFPFCMADIQRRGSILTWTVILSVYGADTNAEVKLLISPFLR